MVIADIYTGDDYAYDLIVSDIPAGQTVISGWLTIKEFATDDDSESIISKNIGTGLTAAGQITVSGVYTRMYFIVPRAETRLLNHLGEYEYSIKALTSANFAKTVAQGTLVATLGVKEGP